jgi:hypothetical protein
MWRVHDERFVLQVIRVYCFLSRQPVVRMQGKHQWIAHQQPLLNGCIVGQGAYKAEVDDPGAKRLQLLP